VKKISFQTVLRIHSWGLGALLLSLGLSACPNYYSQEFVQQLDQTYYNKWPRDYTPGQTYAAQSLGEELQPYFRDHARACGLFGGLNMAFPERDYIPSEIQNYTGTPLQTPVASIRRVMGENVFYYAFPKLNTSLPQGDLAYEPLFQTDELGLSRTFGLSRDYPVVPEKADSWRIRQTCGGFLNSHLASSYDGQQGPPFIPYGAFKAAVQNDKEMKSSVVGVSGTFTSPLARLLSEDDITPDAINLKLRLWYHYRQQAAQGQLEAYLDKMKLLRGFRGLLISRANESSSINALNANGVMTLDLNRLVNIEGKLDAKYSVKNTFESINYNTLIYCADKCDLQPMNLPAPSALLSGFARIQPQGGQDAFSMIQPGRTLRFWQDVAGIPDTYCDSSQARWQVAFKKNGDIFNPNLRPRLSTSPLALERDGVQRCRFLIEGQLRSDRSAEQLAAGQDQLELGFELVNSDPLTYQDTAYQLRIPGQMVFSARNRIHPVVLGKEPVSYERVGSDPRRMSLKWEFDLMFREDQGSGSALVDYGRMNRATGRNNELIRLIENRLEKAEDERLEIRAVPDAQERHFYRVTVLSSKRIDFSQPGSLADESYTLKTDLQVPLKNKETQSVPLELRLLYPVPVASPEPEAHPIWDLFRRP